MRILPVLLMVVAVAQDKPLTPEQAAQKVIAASNDMRRNPYSRPACRLWGVAV